MGELGPPETVKGVQGGGIEPFGEREGGVCRDVEAPLKMLRW